MMATNNQVPIFAFSSENVQNAINEAWNQISGVAENVPEPTRGRAAGFLPSELCYKAMSLVMEESIQRIFQSTQDRRISRSRRGGVVYFPGQPKIAETFTIMIPIMVRGDIYINGVEVKTTNYYHILQECSFEIPQDGKLVALIIDNIVL